MRPERPFDKGSENDERSQNDKPLPVRRKLTCLVFNHLSQQLKLLIRADREAPAARLNRVVSMIESLGVGSARLATEVPR